MSATTIERPRELVIAYMGSPNDKKEMEPAVKVLSFLRTPTDVRTASIHRTTEHSIFVLHEYDYRIDSVYRTVILAGVGMIHALGSALDANCPFPVIALCFTAGSAFQTEEIIAATRTPSRIAPMVMTNAENAGLAAAKIVGQGNPEIMRRIALYQSVPAQAVIDSDPVNREYFRSLWEENPLQKSLDEKAK